MKIIKQENAEKGFPYIAYIPDEISANPALLIQLHGMQDNVVSPNHTIEMIEVLKITNHNVKCDLYEGVGHDSWNKAFSEETLKWLLQQKRNLDKIHP